jgi:hypothetical protein
MMGSEQDCFPVGSLVTLAIAEQYDDAMRRPVEHRAVCHAGANGQPVPQRPSRQLHSRNILVRYVPTELRSILIVRVELPEREETPLCQRRVDARTSVPLAEDEPVALWPSWSRRIHSENSAVEHRDDIGHRKDRPDMRAAAAARHAKRMAADALGEFRSVDRDAFRRRAGIGGTGVPHAA